MPGPLPPARVENNDIKIAAAGSIKMNQETDQAWVYGPGTLTQLAARGFLTDKSPSEPDDERPTNAPDGDAAPRSGSPDSKVKIRTTSMAKNDVPDESTTSKDKAAECQAEDPRRRAGERKGADDDRLQRKHGIHRPVG